MNTKVMFSSSKDDWETPDELFNQLDKEFDFDVDLAATKENAKCDFFISPEEDAFKQNWNMINGMIYSRLKAWLNPPYGKGIIKWLEKCLEESAKGLTIVVLLPARTDTKWFHKFAKLTEIRFLPGRLTFKGAPAPAPFPSLLMIFRPETKWLSGRLG